MSDIKRQGAWRLHDGACCDGQWDRTAQCSRIKLGMLICTLWVPINTHAGWRQSLSNPACWQRFASTNINEQVCLMLFIPVFAGMTVSKLEGHADFSFAAAWHPGGHLLATGNQDTTTLVGSGAMAHLNTALKSLVVQLTFNEICPEKRKS